MLCIWIRWKPSSDHPTGIIHVMSYMQYIIHNPPHPRSRVTPQASISTAPLTLGRSSRILHRRAHARLPAESCCGNFVINIISAIFSTRSTRSTKEYQRPVHPHRNANQTTVRSLETRLTALICVSASFLILDRNKILPQSLLFAFLFPFFSLRNQVCLHTP
jgi:hypothetical protein